ncbi:MAG: DUF4071 domain-containing protein [Sphingomonadales bacterium]|nr:DUF4071 domain-containing protein [Sphingomonadales bacterium]
MVQKPLCFVLMPFGKKVAGGTHAIDFDAVYRDLIKPAIEAADLEPIRADEEETGGIIHKPMFERLVLCDYAVADLTAANANVFYELGVRHAAKERSTVLLFAEGHGRLPFDVAQLRALPYELGADGKPTNIGELSKQLTEKLVSAKSGVDKDSPLYQLLEDYPNIAHEKTDVFRARLAYAADVKSRLATARGIGRAEIAVVEASLGNLNDQEAGVVIDLFLSYRAVEAWDEMQRVHGAMNPIIAATVLVREQLALALNRAGLGERAEEVLKQLVEERGPSSETYGILGRVYKDRWAAAKRDGQAVKANGALRQVISTYRKGFEADWRDAYPGVNALTFMNILDPADPEIEKLEPVVTYAVQRKIETGDSNYWDYATLLELAVLRRDRKAAMTSLEDALSRQREIWEPRTTLNNISLIRDARGADDPAEVWLPEITEALDQAIRGAI